MNKKAIGAGLFAGLFLYAALKLTEPIVSSTTAVKPNIRVATSPNSAGVSVTNTKGDSISSIVTDAYNNPKITTGASSGKVSASHNYDFGTNTQTVKGKVNVNPANSLEVAIKNYGSPIANNSSNSRAFIKNTFYPNSSTSTVAEIVRNASDMKSFYNKFLASVPTFFSKIFGSGKNYTLPDSAFKKVSLFGHDLKIGAKLKGRELVTYVSFA